MPNIQRQSSLSDTAVKVVVRTMLALTGRRSSSRNAQAMMSKYLALAEGLDLESGARPVEVPPMQGVDEDMRRWSYWMLLEHNAIVNRSITAIVVQLARGEPLHGAARIDPKSDVMPAAAAGPEQRENFRESILEHTRAVAGLGRLRGTATFPHPLFGDFDAHRWHGMLALHLRVHLRQAEFVARAAHGSPAEESAGHF